MLYAAVDYHGAMTPINGGQRHLLDARTIGAALKKMIQVIEKRFVKLISV